MESVLSFYGSRQQEADRANHEIDRVLDIRQLIPFQSVDRDGTVQPQAVNPLPSREDILSISVEPVHGISSRC